jgi:hypothetical protein
MYEVARMVIVASTKGNNRRQLPLTQAGIPSLRVRFDNSQKYFLLTVRNEINKWTVSEVLSRKQIIGRCSVS